MSKYINNKEDNPVIFNNVTQPRILTGEMITKSKYKTDENGNIIANDAIINAIDIDWNDALIGDQTIKTSADLLRLIASKSSSNPDDYQDDSIIGVMLSAIRALQAEVTKLRNSFRFGINSYNENNFGMSQTVDELSNIDEEEPLWATDESELSFIDGLDISSNIYDLITPIENYEILVNDKLKYTNTISWSPIKDGVNIFDIPDPKIYIYLTTTSKNINLTFYNKENVKHTLNLQNIIQNNYSPSKYNILIIVSRKKESKDSQYYGENFVWISLSEWGTGTDLFNGYINVELENVDYINPETPVYLSDTYNIESIEFINEEQTDNYIYKLDTYSKYADIKHIVEGSTPTDVEDYKYRTASITIRSISTKEKIDRYINQIQNNELVFCEENKKLYIYNNGKLINIGGSSSGTPEQNIMENYEILKALEAQGLITITFNNPDLENEEEKYAYNNIKSYILSDKFNIDATLNDISEINFINQDTNQKFNIQVDPYGKFVIKEQIDKSMKNYMMKSDGTSIYNDMPNDFITDRTFVSNLKIAKKGLDRTKDVKLNADHIRIGAIYAPLNTDKIFGCTHGYIELANSSDEDFYLDGSYLHYSFVDNASQNTLLNEVTYYSLPLDGYIPAGGTYLIRCKQYSTIDDPNTFIDVKTYDKEWYINNNGKKELLDLTITSTSSLGLALTYGNTVEGELINPSTNLVKSIPADKTGLLLSGKTSAGLFAKGMIDAFYIGSDWGTNNHWILSTAQGVFTRYSNTIYKVTFELDPAKQAFNSATQSDSSRNRWQNSATDYQYVILNNEYIEFPKTKEKKLVADYTPKASFEHKNVITDKSTLDKTKPNAIVCSFGINPYTTRCFNWVSCGSFDEAVVIIDPNTNKEYIFESYKNISEEKTQSILFPRRKEFSVEINNIIYGSGKLSETNGERLYNKFPGNNESYTSHKCIIDIIDTPVESPITYQYYICRLNKFGKVDDSYKSDIRTFTLYPNTYQPRIYQITDQQGFHWIEYQAWGAAARKINELIDNDKESDTIMPIIINTGDVVQSGARVNEWLDYFSSGEYLFNHYEQMNVVGNNDLCDTNINKLGTGDDTGKSNGYFFHIFNCYEVDTSEYKPIINNIYVPSLYYMDIKSNNKDVRLLFIDSEITKVNCKDWFKLTYNDLPVNIYTGYTISSNQTYVADELNFKPIYEILYQWTNNENISYLPICHEMPFTVITNNCLSWTLSSNEYSKYRSLSDTSTLIGSHTNQIDATEDGKGLHWMSRLFEYRNITLCLGGHKHTYACTYPVRENYLYTENNEEKWSYKDGPMTMPASLKDDTANWKVTINITVNGEQQSKKLNLSKFPIVKRQDAHKSLDVTEDDIYQYTFKDEQISIKVTKNAPKRFYPFVDAKTNDNNNFVIYFMCQATGYKLTSNKELPSDFQKFSMIIPKTVAKLNETTGKTSDTASVDQQMPMFAIIDILGNNTYLTKLARIFNIGSGAGKWKFSQLQYGTKDAIIQYLIMTKTILFGMWLYYDTTKNAFIKADNDDNTKILIPMNWINETDKTFNINDNEDFILYKDIISENSINLFKISSKGQFLTE